MKLFSSLYTIILSLVIVQPVLANTVKFTFNGPSLDQGRLVIGAGGNNTSVDFPAGLSPGQLALFVCFLAKDPNKCQAMGNMVIYDGARGGGYITTPGSQSPITVTRMLMPPLPAQPAIPPKAINIFGPAGGTVVIGKDGKITKTFNGSGINIISSINFNANDTVQQINTMLFNDLNSQAGSLPSGFSFSLESNGVSLVGTNLFDIEVTDEISFTNGGTVDIPFGAELTDVSVPEPTSTLSLLALGTLGAGATLKRKLKPSKSTIKETTKVG